MSELACHLITLCYDLARNGGPLQPLLAALRQLAAYWPHLLLPHLVDLAQLVAMTGVHLFRVFIQCHPFRSCRLYSSGVIIRTVFNPAAAPGGPGTADGHHRCATVSNSLHRR